MKLSYAVVVLSVSLLAPLGDTFAQRPNNRRGGGNMRGQVANGNGNQQMQRRGPMRMNDGQDGEGNMMGEGNRPDPAQMAQRMMANFDSDGSGSLDQAELQAALAGMQQRRMMQRRGNEQDQMQGGPIQTGQMQRGNQMRGQRNRRGGGGAQSGQATRQGRQRPQR